MTLFHQDIDAEIERLRALHSTDLLTAPAPAEFEEACHRARMRFGVPVALITLLGGDRLVAKAGLGLSLRETSRRYQFCDEVARRDEVLVVPDARKDVRFAANPLVAGPPFLRFYAGAPLTYVRGVRLGALCLMDHRPRDLSPCDQAELERIAEGVMAAVLERQFERIAAATVH